jgi:hypothetical protein
LKSGGGKAAGGKEDTPSKCKGWRGKKQKKRDVKRVYAMSAEEKETLKWRMVETDKAGTGDKESTPPSLTPV